MRFLDYFSKAKAEKCNEQDLSVFDTFEIIIPCPVPYHLDVGAAVSLEVTTKASLRGKKISENLDF